MVECGTVEHQNAKVMYENKPNKENKNSNYANTNVEIMERVCGKYR